MNGAYQNRLHRRVENPMKYSPVCVHMANSQDTPENLVFFQNVARYGFWYFIGTRSTVETTVCIWRVKKWKI